MLQHPYHHTGDRFEYARLGEAKFIASKQRLFAEAFQADPQPIPAPPLQPPTTERLEPQRTSFAALLVGDPAR